ncbi:MAG: dTDP-4-dehydrorhamnose 3,5-epimerase [Candidatus Brocadiae bacterium]|nr:dTDP-4-dehydrorhamnose 3,5-epimerase [Candidatus Brocadiia bacterium]
MPFTFETLPVPGLILIRPRAFGDERGYFLETWRKAEFERAGIRADWIQDNEAHSARRGTLRGLHFQRDPHAQAKLVRCVHGSVWDVAVDLRPGSPTRGRFAAVELSAENRSVLFVPRGFAHGYLTLTDGADVLYKVDADYAPAAEGGLAWDDPDLAIPWPLAPVELNPRDRAWPRLRDLPTSP